MAADERAAPIIAEDRARLEQVLGRGLVWGAIEHGALVSLVGPSAQGRDFGTALLEFAMAMRLSGLRLFAPA